MWVLLGLDDNRILLGVWVLVLVASWAARPERPDEAAPWVLRFDLHMCHFVAVAHAALLCWTPLSGHAAEGGTGSPKNCKECHPTISGWQSTYILTVSRWVKCASLAPNGPANENVFESTGKFWLLAPLHLVFRPTNWRLLKCKTTKDHQRTTFAGHFMVYPTFIYVLSWFLVWRLARVCQDSKPPNDGSECVPGTAAKPSKSGLSGNHRFWGTVIFIANLRLDTL